MMMMMMENIEFLDRFGKLDAVHLKYKLHYSHKCYIYAHYMSRLQFLSHIIQFKSNKSTNKFEYL